MKSYIRNKGFIPEKFISKVKDENLKGEKRVLVILLCFNLMYLPLNIDLLNKSHNEDVEKVNIKSYSYKEGLDSKKIYSVVETLLSDGIKECNITSDGGNIVVSSIINADEISNNKVFNVEQIELTNNDEYELRVNNYE